MWYKKSSRWLTLRELYHFHALWNTTHMCVVSFDLHNYPTWQGPLLFVCYKWGCWGLKPGFLISRTSGESPWKRLFRKPSSTDPPFLSRPKASLFPAFLSGSCSSLIFSCLPIHLVHILCSLPQELALLFFPWWVQFPPLSSPPHSALPHVPLPHLDPLLSSTVCRCLIPLWTLLLPECESASLLIFIPSSIFNTLAWTCSDLICVEFRSLDFLSCWKKGSFWVGTELSNLYMFYCIGHSTSHLADPQILNE